MHKGKGLRSNGNILKGVEGLPGDMAMTHVVLGE